MTAVDTFGNPLPQAAEDEMDAAWATAVADQIVAGYDDATDRDTAETSPVTGRMVYLRTPSLLQVYDGSSWQTVLAPGVNGGGMICVYAAQHSLTMPSGGGAVALTLSGILPSYISASRKRIHIVQGSANNQQTQRSILSYHSATETGITIVAYGDSSISSSGACYFNLYVFEVVGP